MYNIYIYIYFPRTQLTSFLCVVSLILWVESSRIWGPKSCGSWISPSRKVSGLDMNIYSLHITLTWPMARLSTFWDYIFSRDFKFKPSFQGPLAK